MDTHEVAYWVVIALSSFSLGGAGFWAWMNRGIRPWLSVFKVGYMLSVGTILWVVFPRQVVDPSPFFWVYSVGLGLAAIGALGDLRRTIKFFVSLTEPEDALIDKGAE